MKKLLALAVGLFLCGCGGAPVQEPQDARTCMPIEDFLEKWNCIQGKSVPGAPDIVARFRANGDLIAEQRREGKITNTEANAAFINMTGSLADIEHQREAGGSSSTTTTTYVSVPTYRQHYTPTPHYAPPPNVLRVTPYRPSRR